MSALHTASRLALRFLRPGPALRLVSALGRLAPRLSRGEAQAYMVRLSRRGTCLSRSLAVASRLPGAKVMIGAVPVGYRAMRAAFYGARGRDVLQAHAWVELDGRPLEGQEPLGKVLGTLELARPATDSCYPSGPGRSFP